MLTTWLKIERVVAIKCQKEGEGPSSDDPFHKPPTKASMVASIALYFVHLMLAHRRWVSALSIISMWDTSRVTTMESMFQDIAAFKFDLSNWDTSRVVDMNAMLESVRFDTDIHGMTDLVEGYTVRDWIGYWDVQKVQKMD